MPAPTTFATLADLAALSSRAYGLTPFTGTPNDGLPAGWRYLDYVELGSFQMPLLQGYDSNGYYVASEIQAFVATDDTGKVALIFRGTDSIVDVLTDINIAFGIVFSLVNAFGNLATAAIQYASTRGFEFLTVGHSLGGAIAEALASAYPSVAGGLSIGGPGFYGLIPGGSIQNPNFYHVAHDRDGVGHFTFPNVHIGTELLLADRSFDYSYGGSSHSIVTYAATMNFLYQSEAFGDLSPALLDRVYLADRSQAFNGLVPSAETAFIGTNSGDVIVGIEHNDVLRIDGGSGNDIIDGGWNQDVLAGGYGNDIIHGNYGNDTLYGGNNDDTLYGDQGSDSMSGGDGNDILFGGSQNDYLEGGNGNDLLIGGNGGDYYSVGFGQGRDTVADAGNASQPDVLRIYGGSLITSTNLETVAQAAGLHLDVAANGFDLLVRCYDTSGALIIDVTIENMGAVGNQIERLELYAGPQEAYVGQIDLFYWWETHTGGNANPPVEPPIILPSISQDTRDDVYSGTPSNDSFLTAGGRDTVYGGEGSDTLTVDYRWSSTVLTGGYNSSFGLFQFYVNETNFVNFSSIETLVIYATSGDDNIQLSSAGTTDTIEAGAGNDIVRSGYGEDTLRGGDGDDQLFVGEGGADWLDGGSGFDVATINRSSSTLNLTYLAAAAATSTGYTMADGTHVRNIESIDLYTGSGNDVVITGIGSAAASNDYVDTSRGDDQISVGGGYDRVYGGEGSDTLTVDYRWSSTVLTGGYNSSFGLFQFYVNETNFVNFSSIETLVIYATSGDDNIQLSSAGTTDTIEAGAGNDIVRSGYGEDTLRGGDGDDMLDGGGDIDTLFGDAGNDRLILGAEAAGSIINGGSGIDALVINSNTTLASLSGIEALELTGGANLTLTGAQFSTGLARNSAISGNGSITVNMDAGINFLSQSLVFSGSGVTLTVNGSAGTDIIKCGAAAHNINSGDGNDQIRGSTFADIINGGAGNDKIIGFTGADIITGGTGNDQFRYWLASDSGLGVGADRITDYTIGQDRLNFAALDTNADVVGIQGFAFVGSAAFSGGGAAQIRYTNSGADLLVQADINGDGVADMEIILQGNAGGTLTDFDFMMAVAAEQPLVKGGGSLDSEVLFAGLSDIPYAPNHMLVPPMRDYTEQLFV